MPVLVGAVSVAMLAAIWLRPLVQADAGSGGSYLQTPLAATAITAVPFFLAWLVGFCARRAPGVFTPLRHPRKALQFMNLPEEARLRAVRPLVAEFLGLPVFSNIILLLQSWSIDVQGGSFSAFVLPMGIGMPLWIGYWTWKARRAMLSEIESAGQPPAG